MCRDRRNTVTIAEALGTAETRSTLPQPDALDEPGGM